VQTVGVFGEEMILWICLLRQSPQRPPADHVHRQAMFMLDQLKASPAAQALPVISVDDGMFAIAALLDEFAMFMPDLRPMWSARPLQAVRWATNNAGAEVFERLKRVRQGPKTVVATYYAVIGLGFQGMYAIPGANTYDLEQLRRELGRELNVDPDRDWNYGALRTIREDEKHKLAPKIPFVKGVWMGRILATLVLGAGASFLGFALSRALS
jgi:type VI secretion system protein ImpK